MMFVRTLLVFSALSCVEAVRLVLEVSTKAEMGMESDLGSGVCQCSSLPNADIYHSVRCEVGDVLKALWHCSTSRYWKAKVVECNPDSVRVSWPNYPSMRSELVHKSCVLYRNHYTFSYGSGSLLSTENERKPVPRLARSSSGSCQCNSLPRTGRFSYKVHCIFKVTDADQNGFLSLEEVNKGERGAEQISQELYYEIMSEFQKYDPEADPSQGMSESDMETAYSHPVHFETDLNGDWGVICGK